MNRFLIRLSRTIAYILIPIFIFILISGYRNTGYFTFMTRGTANLLHIVYLNIAFIFLATVHALISIRTALMRNKVKGKYIDILLLITGIVFIAGFSYFAF